METEDSGMTGLFESLIISGFNNIMILKGVEVRN